MTTIGDENSMKNKAFSFNEDVSVNLYLKDIRTYKLLERQEEVEIEKLKHKCHNVLEDYSFEGARSYGGGD